MSIHQYFDNLPHALMAFQYLETSLKFYIRDCDRIIQKSVKNSFRYSIEEKEIEKMPLGRLIEQFAKRSNREDIILVLKKLNKLRNEIAHTAYILTAEHSQDSQRMKKLSDRVAKITEAVEACFTELVREHSRVTNESIDDEILNHIWPKK